MAQKPLLIAGPTASGKSSLAIALAQELGGAVINADALQVYSGWRVLTARPSESDEAACPHHLYGHLAMDTPYSVGHWLRELETVLADVAKASLRPIIIGGTGLYFTALTQGLAEIPPIPDDIRKEGDEVRQKMGASGFLSYLAINDPALMERVDQANAARLQRAWEVHQATGRALSSWQANTSAPLLERDKVHCFVLKSPRDWLAARIESRFHQMVEQGGLEEVHQMKIAGYDPASPSMQALGARELRAGIEGEMAMDDAITRAVISTRQYAKRQRSWFRSKMAEWHALDPTQSDKILGQALAIVK